MRSGSIPPSSTGRYHCEGKQGVLENPLTGELLDYDRFYYSHWVAFEFQGQQHYTATEHYGEDVVAAQQRRDEIKRKLSSLGITASF